MWLAAVVRHVNSFYLCGLHAGFTHLIKPPIFRQYLTYYPSEYSPLPCWHNPVNLDQCQSFSCIPINADSFLFISPHTLHQSDLLMPDHPSCNMSLTEAQTTEGRVFACEEQFIKKASADIKILRTSLMSHERLLPELLSSLVCLTVTSTFHASSQ